MKTYVVHYWDNGIPTTIQVDTPPFLDPNGIWQFKRGGETYQMVHNRYVRRVELVG